MGVRGPSRVAQRGCGWGCSYWPQWGLTGGGGVVAGGDSSGEVMRKSPRGQLGARWGTRPGMRSGSCPPPTSEHRRKTPLCQRGIPGGGRCCRVVFPDEDGHEGPTEGGTHVQGGYHERGTFSPQRVRCGGLPPCDSRAGSSASYGALGALQDASGHWLYWDAGCGRGMKAQGVSASSSSVP